MHGRMTRIGLSLLILIMVSAAPASQDGPKQNQREEAINALLATPQYSSGDLAQLIRALKAIPDWDESLLASPANRQALAVAVRLFRDADPNCAEAAIAAFDGYNNYIDRREKTGREIERENYRPIILLRLLFDLPSREMTPADRRQRTQDRMDGKITYWTIAGVVPMRSMDDRPDVPQSLSMPFAWDDAKPSLVALPRPVGGGTGVAYEPAKEYRYFLSTYPMRQSIDWDLDEGE